VSARANRANARASQAPLKIGDRVKFYESSGFAGKYGAVVEINEFGQPIVRTTVGDRVTITSGWTGGGWRRIPLRRGSRRRHKR